MVRLIIFSAVLTVFCLPGHSEEPSSVGLENMAQTLRGDVRLIAMGDSYSVPWFSRVPISGMRVWPIPNITAIGGGAALFSNFVTCKQHCNPVSLIRASDDLGYTVERSSSEAYFTLPIGGLQEIYSSNSFDDEGTDRLFEFKLDPAGRNYMSTGVHGVFNVSGDDLAFRFLYRCPSDISMQIEEIKVFDNTEEVVTMLLRENARRLWHYGEDPTKGVRQAIPRQINAYASDFPAQNNTYSALSMSLSQTTPLAGTNKYFEPAGCVYYHRDPQGNRKSGLYYNCIADNSWADAGFGSDAEGNGSHDKKFSLEQFTYWLDVTTLDRNQPTVFMWYLAQESLSYNTVTLRMTNMIEQAEQAASLVGLTSVEHFIVIPHLFSMESGEEQARQYTLNQQNAAFDLATKRSNVSAASIFAATDEILFNGPDAIPWLLYKGFDAFEFGSNSIDLVSFSNGDLLDETDMHPKNEESAAFFAAVLGNIIHDAGCPADIVVDGIIGVNDLLRVIDDWGNSGVGDINQDGITDILDLLLVVDSWGDCWPVQSPFNTAGY